MSNVRGIGGIFFKASDPKGLADWYDTHLGVKRDEHGYTSFGWRKIDRPDEIGLTVFSAFPAETDYFGDKAEFMVNFRVDDLAATLARLSSEGVELVGEPIDEDYGKFAWCLDGEGNRVELWQPPGGVPFDVTVPEGPASKGELGGVWAADPGTTIAAIGGMSDQQIVKEREFALPVETVWDLWTSSEGLGRWLLDTTSVDLRIGGDYEFYFMADAPKGTRGGEGCKVLSFLPNRMLSFTWNAPPNLDHTRARHTHVVLEFEARGESTLLRLNHLGWPANDDHAQWPETVAYFDAAWDRVFDALAAFAAENGN